MMYHLWETCYAANREMRESDSGVFEHQQLPSVNELVAGECPTLPLYCVRPATIISACRRFISRFKGNVLYSVKCNTEPFVLDAIWRGGVRHFDCASLTEIKLVRMRFPSAIIHFLHPVKSKKDIAEAYTRWAVRTFVLDSNEALEKIIEATNTNENKDNEDLVLLVRLALPDNNDKQCSLYPLSGKFGVEGIYEAANLLQRARGRARYLGICFHVGSQCVDPNAYAQALAHASQVISRAGIPLEVVDVGGGFPTSYPHSIPPPLDSYMSIIEQGCERLPSEFVSNARIWCEPGRALVADSGSLVIRVETRRPTHNILHVNDGTYGNLRIAGSNTRWQFPVRLLRHSTAELVPFTFFGPTCDSVDYMPGPFMLPDDIHCDDYIEIGRFGAYNTETRTSFNGFDRTLVARVRDPPMLLTSSYNND